MAVLILRMLEEARIDLIACSLKLASQSLILQALEMSPLKKDFLLEMRSPFFQRPGVYGRSLLIADLRKQINQLKAHLHFPELISQKNELDSNPDCATLWAFQGSFKIPLPHNGKKNPCLFTIQKET